MSRGVIDDVFSRFIKPRDESSIEQGGEEERDGEERDGQGNNFFVKKHLTVFFELI